jgi:D-alanine-D-alanine ligase-like ATP-grasp enzyme
MTLFPLPSRTLVFIPYKEEPEGPRSPQYDLPGYRAEIDAWMRELGVEWEWVPITFSSLATEVARARRLAEDEEFVVFNMCDGSTLDGYPGLEVVNALISEGLPFTGANAEFYQVTTSKKDSKARFVAAGVPTAPWVVASTDEDVERAVATLPLPLFVKPDVSAGSSGIQIGSVVRDLASARRQVAALRQGLHDRRGTEFGDVLIESFIQGREFTVLLIEDPREPLGVFVLPPGERVFDPRVRPSERFLAYERYWGLPEAERPIPAGDPYYWYELAPPSLRPAISDIARRAFRAVNGEGYARVDFRLDERTGHFYVLEVNSQCGLSSDDSSSVGTMLNLCGVKMTAIIDRILRHGMTRGARQPLSISRGARAVASHPSA